MQGKCLMAASGEVSTHSEPQNPRSGAKGEHMTAEGAVEVAQFVQDLAARVKARLLPPKP